MSPARDLLSVSNVVELRRLLTLVLYPFPRVLGGHDPKAAEVGSGKTSWYRILVSNAKS